MPLSSGDPNARIGLGGYFRGSGNLVSRDRSKLAIVRLPRQVTYLLEDLTQGNHCLGFLRVQVALTTLIFITVLTKPPDPDRGLPKLADVRA